VHVQVQKQPIMRSVLYGGMCKTTMTSPHGSCTSDTNHHQEREKRVVLWYVKDDYD
jgi:hypothetical protein